MTPKKTTPTPPKKSPPAKRRPHPCRPTYTASQKVQAVLAVWTNRCPPTEVCRQLQIPWVTFNHWQQRAMRGMLQALEARAVLSQALSPRLQQLLEKQQQTNTLDKLTKRLDQIPQTKLASPPASPSKMG